ALLVNAVARLMKNTEDGGTEEVAVVARRDPHVIRTETGRERVGGPVKAPPQEIETELAGDLPSELLLQLFVIRAFQMGIIRFVPAVADALQQPDGDF